MSAKSHIDQVKETWGDVETYVHQVWGPDAEFDLVGKSCLIHLDHPDAATRAERVAKFTARSAELEHANCPLCREMANLGGDEVFDESPVDAHPRAVSRPRKSKVAS